MVLSESEKLTLIEQFHKITKLNKEESKGFLEAFNFNLNTAIESFYEVESNDTKNEQPISIKHSVNSEPKNRIKTFEDFANSSDESGNENDGNNPSFYNGDAGKGSSGTSFLNPKRKEDVDEIFNFAIKKGAKQVFTSDEPSSSNKPFSGRGYRLDNNNSNNDQASSSTQESTSLQCIHFRFYSNGILMNDTFQPYNSKNQEEYLIFLKTGRLPLKLAQLLGIKDNAEIHLHDNRNEEYTVENNPTSLKPFSGSSTRLGTPTPEIISKQSSSSTKTNTSTNTANINTPTLDINFDLPVSGIQIRLFNGERHVVKINHTVHTTRDIYNIVSSINPNDRREFVLLSSYPISTIPNDELTTIESAGLKDCNIIQKLL